MGFSSLAGSGPKVGPKKWFRGRFCEEKRAETHIGPTFGPPPANDEKPIFDPLLCEIICLTILALRDLRPIKKTPEINRGRKFSPKFF